LFILEDSGRGHARLLVPGLKEPKVIEALGSIVRASCLRIGDGIESDSPLRGPVPAGMAELERVRTESRHHLGKLRVVIVYIEVASDDYRNSRCCGGNRLTFYLRNLTEANLARRLVVQDQMRTALRLRNQMSIVDIQEIPSIDEDPGPKCTFSDAVLQSATILEGSESVLGDWMA
jgi:hypothetical protein